MLNWGKFKNENNSCLQNGLNYYIITVFGHAVLKIKHIIKPRCRFEVAEIAFTGDIHYLEPLYSENPNKLFILMLHFLFRFGLYSNDIYNIHSA